MRAIAARYVLLPAAILSAACQAHAANNASCAASDQPNRVHCTLDLGSLTATGTYIAAQQNSAFQWTDVHAGDLHPGFMTIESSGAAGAVISFDPGYGASWGGSGYSETIYGSLEVWNLSFAAKPGYVLNDIVATVEGQAHVYGVASIEVTHPASGGPTFVLNGSAGQEQTESFSLSASVANGAHGLWFLGGYAAYAPGPNGTASVFGLASIDINKVSYQVSVSAVPEPAAAAMAGIGGMLALWAARRRPRVC